MKTLQLILVVAAGMLAAGCEDRYRYTCQDPDNWNKEECQMPRCEAEGFCPDHVVGKGIAPAVELEQTDTQCNCDEENNNVE